MELAKALLKHVEEPGRRIACVESVGTGPTELTASEH